MMQLGFVSAILPDLPFESVIATAADLGYSCVELMCWPVGKADRRYAGVTHLDVQHFDDAAASEINQQLVTANVQLSGLGYYPNLLTPICEDADRFAEHLKAVIRAAAMLGVGNVNTFVGRDPAKSVDENWARFLEVWRPMMSYADEHDIRIGIENCPMLFSADEWPGGKNIATTPAIWRRMFDAIPSDHFGLNFDPSHFVWQQMDYLTPLREFAGRLFHIHAKDVRIDQHRLNDVGILASPLDYHCPKLPGLGDVNWGRFFSVLSDVGYQGPVCVEVEDRAYEGSLDARKSALRQSADYLRQFMP